MASRGWHNAFVHAAVVVVIGLSIGKDGLEKVHGTHTNAAVAVSGVRLLLLLRILIQMRPRHAGAEVAARGRFIVVATAVAASGDPHPALRKRQIAAAGIRR